MKKFILGLAVALCATSTAAMAEVTVSGGVDLVSTYVWRGAYQSGAAIQPGMAVSAGNFTFGAWGSSSLDDSATVTPKELDFCLGYEVGGFSIAVTDYWYTGLHDLYLGQNDHIQEVSVGYGFDCGLGIAWSTNIGGDDDNSSYLELGYSFEISDVAIDATVGYNPWDSAYGDAGFASIGVCVSKDLVVTDSFSIPLFVETSISPINDNAYLVAGMSFSF